MNTFHYQVLRYMPDRVSGEFVNLGIVTFDPKSYKISSRFFDKITRVSNFFPKVNSRSLASSIKFLQKEFDSLSSKINSEFLFDKKIKIEEITKQILPKDDSALFFTDQREIIDLNIENITLSLFKRIVVNNVEDVERDYINDKDVWSKIYKNYFDNLGITTHFKSHTIKTQLDTWEFDKAWKNGAWNCFESISFDLLKSDSIKDKVYKWSGKINELQTSKEPIHVYLLAKLPEEHHELSSFIKKKLDKIQFKNDVKIELIDEGSAERFAKKIKKQIEEHSA